MKNKIALELLKQGNTNGNEWRKKCSMINRLVKETIAVAISMN